LAEAQSVNPYWIICDCDDFRGYTDEMLQQFLTENGYVKPAEPVEPEKPAESHEDNANNTDIKVNGSEANNNNTPLKGASDMSKGIDDAKEETVKQKDTEKHIAHQNPYVETLRTRIENKLIEMTPDDLKKIESINEKNALELLKSLYLRSEYDEEIKRLAVIVKLALLL
jgi:hypothetical protein